MKGILVPLTGIMLCAATLHSVAGDALETKQDAELHAAVTDMPDTIDMSHADPIAWGTLPLANQVDVKSPATDPGTDELRSSNPLQQAALARAALLPDI